MLKIMIWAFLSRLYSCDALQPTFCQNVIKFVLFSKYSVYSRRYLRISLEVSLLRIFLCFFYLYLYFFPSVCQIEPVNTWRLWRLYSSGWARKLMPCWLRRLLFIRLIFSMIHQTEQVNVQMAQTPLIPLTEQDIASPYGSQTPHSSG